MPHAQGASRIRLRLVTCTLLALAAAGGPSAFGRAGVLDRPGVALPAGSGLDAVNAALADPSFRFVGGRYVNAATDLYYGGGEADAGRLLAALAACDGAAIEVRFRTRAQAAVPLVRPADAVDPLPADARWHVGHNGWADPGRLTVTVFLGEGGLDVTQIDLPAWGGRPAAGPHVSEPAGE